MQMPVFIVLFFAPVYVPLALLTGWIEAEATLNPITYVLEAERSMLAGDEIHVALAFGLAVVLGDWASRSGRCAVCARRRRPARSGTVAPCLSPRNRPLAPFRSSPEPLRFAPGLRRHARWPCAWTGGDQPLTETEDGVWEGQAPAAPGDDYRFVLDGGTPGPTRARAGSPREFAVRPGFSTPSAFEIEPGPALALEELVLYELHVGTFSREGTFDGVIPRLAGLRELGITAIELMPVATFPGNRGWGYDGLYPFAPHPVYGGPEGLARLVDAAHREGLGVVLDVVYNHIGPGNEALRAFGPYFTDRFGETPWGEALDFSQAGVREWAIQNAELWVRDYGIDGLRLDAVHAVQDDSDRHVLAELADRVHAVASGRARDQRDGPA